MGEKLFYIGELGDRDLSASGGYLPYARTQSDDLTA